jgi:hypothetical protein
VDKQLLDPGPTPEPPESREEQDKGCRKCPEWKKKEKRKV